MSDAVSLPPSVDQPTVRAGMRMPPLHQGAIGNGRVLALVAPDSSIDWLSMPRFDSGTLFAPLLDPERAGRWRLETAAGGLPDGVMSYIRNTNVLTNRFTTDGAAFDLVDFAPRIVEGLSVRTPPEIARLILPVSGRPHLRMRFDPRPDYGRAAVRMHDAGGAVVIEGAGGPLRLYSNVPSDFVLEGREFLLDRPRHFVLRWGDGGETPSVEWARHQLALTVDGWRAWARTCSLGSFAPAETLRSALCLKLHIYEETGAIIAAATGSLPEAPGSGRTWDYRYCWLRDSAFVVGALRRLSHLAEGERFITFLRDVAEAGPLQPVYGIGGERDLTESILPHLRGCDGVGPVRVGNSAAGQPQHDLQGEMILCLQTLMEDERVVLERPAELLPLIRALVTEALRLAPQPDTGIWEYRTMLRHHTFSRTMAWGAAPRGARLARLLGDQGSAAAWEAAAATEREVILTRGYNAGLGMFTQALDGSFADASGLLLAPLGLISPRDPRFLSTLRAYERELLCGGLMMRYGNADDLGKPTTAFTICSFWWVEALALAGRLDEAVEVFRRVARHANPLGLYSEDIDPASGALTGNFPQAYTHVGLINAAMTLSSLLEARDGRVSAWE